MPPEALEENSLEKFRALLTRASTETALTAYELDGQRSAAGDAYGMAGRIVLNQSDLLIVVWDGGKAAGTGGTVDTLHEAISYHLPVIWIDPFAPANWKFIVSANDLVSIQASGFCEHLCRSAVYLIAGANQADRAQRIKPTH